MYSEESESAFDKIIQMHPKLKPASKEKANHIWCITSDIPAGKTVDSKMLKPLADHLSKSFDMPVSLYAGKTQFSLASFWDHR